MPTASFILDHAEHVTAWSPAAAAWFGRPAADVLGRHCGLFLTGTATSVLAEARGRAARGEEYSRVVPAVCGDGSRLDVLLTCSPLVQSGAVESDGPPEDAASGLLCQVAEPPAYAGGAGGDPSGAHEERPSRDRSGVDPSPDGRPPDGSPDTGRSPSSRSGRPSPGEGPSPGSRPSRGGRTQRAGGAATGGAGTGKAAGASAGEALASARHRADAHLLDAFVQSSPHGMGILDTDLRYVMVNDVLAGFNGIPAEGHVGRSVSDIVQPADRGEYEKHLRMVLETGEPLHNVLVSGRTQGSRDRDRVWSVSFFRMTGEDGRVLGLGGTIVDVTEKQTALAEASGVRRRLDLINRAGSSVGTTLDLTWTARELTDFVVPDFADVAAVEMRADIVEGNAVSAPSVPVTTVLLARKAAAGARGGSRWPATPGSRRVHSQGSDVYTVLCGNLPWSGVRAQGGEDEAALDSVEETLGLPERGLGSAVMAPLLARGRCLGFVTFGRFAERDPLDEDDRRVAEELAARTALNLDNARLYDDERRTAVALQRNMLPHGKDIPVREGLEVGYHYWSTSRSADVGGDFFDVIPLSGHRIALVVGDMMGHDIHAAAGMGQLRTAMHTLARLDLEPAELLTRLDGIVESSPAMQHATCVYAVYNTVTRQCEVVSAGHPPPILRHRDGVTGCIPVEPGVPLGMGLGTPGYRVTRLEVPEGGTLVLYTDGLVEQRGEDIEAGIGALESALAEPEPSGSLQAWCDSVVFDLAPRSAGDDLALLMARATPMPSHRSVSLRLPPEPAMAARARAFIDRTLTAWGLDALRDKVRLLANELVTNAFRHGRGDVGVQLAKGGSLVVEVSDADERLPHRADGTVDGEWGRGLTLVDELAAKWGARSVSSGKVVWFELPLGG